MKLLFHKLFLCKLDKHKFNILNIEFGSAVYLECRYCDKKTISYQPEWIVNALLQRKIFNTELKLNREVLIEKIPSLLSLLNRYAKIKESGKSLHNDKEMWDLSFQIKTAQKNEITT